MAKPYTTFIREYIARQGIGEPIYSSHIAQALAESYQMEKADAAAATAVAVKRIMDGGMLPDLRCYQKGIYYRTAKTPFGEAGIHIEQLIADKYLLPDIGYETGLAVLHRLGLTTQMPRERVLATNAAKGGARVDVKLGVTVRPAKTIVTAENKEYLRLLDMLDLLERAPVDAPQPYAILAQHIRKAQLRYSRLLAYADRYYSRGTVLQVAHTANEGGLTE